VKVAQFVTLNVNTGPDGDNDRQRTLATIQTTVNADHQEAENDRCVPERIEPGWRQRFEGLSQAGVTDRRTSISRKITRRPSFSSRKKAQHRPSLARTFLRPLSPCKDQLKTGRSRTGRWRTTNFTCIRSIFWFGHKTTLRSMGLGQTDQFRANSWI
jgi:hypothetical protein